MTRLPRPQQSSPPDRGRVLPRLQGSRIAPRTVEAPFLGGSSSLGVCLVPRLPRQICLTYAAATIPVSSGVAQGVHLITSSSRAMQGLKRRRFVLLPFHIQFSIAYGATFSPHQVLLSPLQLL